ncbi:hypothetical protein KJA13_02580 [Patescibacteria group bacterium]|nr:hypothetical protein [Patescibacteria group bacterium]
MNKKDFLIIGAGIVILVAIILVAVLTKVPGEVNVITEKTEYKIGDVIKVKIENNLKKNVCFSSCYPYYLEKKEEEWKSYDYMGCPNSDLVKDCIDSRQVKAFELIVPPIEEGLHRLAISVCIGCNLDEVFREDQKFYSNEFIINE